MIGKFLTIITICLLVSNVFTESNEAFSDSPNQGFLQPELSNIDINQLIKCGTTLSLAVKEGISVIQDMFTNPKNIGVDISRFVAFYVEVSEDCTGIFNISPIQKLSSRLSFEKNLRGIPSTSALIPCLNSIQPLSNDILNAVNNFKNGNINAALDNIKQASVDTVTLGYTCYKLIDEFSN